MENEKLLMERKTGFAKFKILSINPNDEELSEIMEEESEAPEYIFERRGIKCAIIDIYLSDNNDNVFKYTIWVEDKEKESKNSGAKLYVNQLSDTQWSNNEDNLWESFKVFEKVIDWKLPDGKISEYYSKGAKPNTKDIYGEKKYHIAKIGEAEILHLLKHCDERFSAKNADINLFLDMDKLFAGDFSEIKNSIQIGEPLFVGFAYVQNDEENYEQKIFSSFVPLASFSTMATNNPGKYDRKVFEEWHRNFDFVKNKAIYNFGKLQNIKEEFIPKSKEIDEDSSDY